MRKRRGGEGRRGEDRDDRGGRRVMRKRRGREKGRGEDRDDRGRGGGGGGGDPYLLKMCVWLTR